MFCCVCKCYLSSTQLTASQKISLFYPKLLLRNSFYCSASSTQLTTASCFCFFFFSFTEYKHEENRDPCCILFSISFQQWAHNKWANACWKNESGISAFGHNKVIGARFIFLLWKNLNCSYRKQSLQLTKHLTDFQSAWLGEEPRRDWEYLE